MSYVDAIKELRQMLSDTETHKRSSRKKIIGNIDGQNTKFRSFDKRIIPSTLEVYVNGAKIVSSIDDAVAGELSLGSAPPINSKVEATYYWQWWLDGELKTFLNKGAESTGQFSNNTPDNSYMSIQPGLKTAALKFAASMAIDSVIQYMINRKHSGEFLLEQDGNKDDGYSSMIDAMRRQAEKYWKEAVFHRDDFYKRLGARNAPAFANKFGAVKRYGPQR